MKIAIIGTGITGNAAAWLLNKRFDITVFEKNDYIGGHSNTIQADGHPAVDTGFIVYNEWTYPNLIALFDHLDVATEKTDMSFAVSLGQQRSKGSIEYSGDAIFAQKSNLLRPRFYKMLLDIRRFYKNAPDVLKDDGCKNMSLAGYIEKHGYSKAFTDDHLYPMAAAIWSTEAEDIGQFPVRSFVRFFVNHGLFLFKNRPQWHTVKGGSREYVRKLTASFADKIQLQSDITAIHRNKNGNKNGSKNDVTITMQDGTTHAFDHVIMACHPDESLALLNDATENETSVLSAFPYAENIAYLHQDETLMPARKSVWSSWNYLGNRKDNKQNVTVTYWMNKLQTFLPDDHPLFVTLNPPMPPAKDKTIRTIKYDHPQYTMDALNGWKNIGKIQGIKNTWFCGAWCGYGFHEDGLSAGLAVAEDLSVRLGDPVKRPWNITEKSPAGIYARKK